MEAIAVVVVVLVAAVLVGKSIGLIREDDRRNAVQRRMAITYRPFVVVDTLSGRTIEVCDSWNVAAQRASWLNGGVFDQRFVVQRYTGQERVIRVLAA